jgi:cytochrome P450
LIGIHNLLVSNGKEHERARKMLNPAFHFDNLQSMISIMTDQTSKVIDILLQSSTKMNLTVQFNALTLSIIASSAFGQSFETISNAREIVERTFKETLSAIVYRTSRMITLIPIVSKLPFWRIKDQALTFVLAGHETTSNLMAWVMYELMTNPSVYQACQNEVDRILPNQTIPTYEHLNDLPIIEAVLQETLRLYPPAPFFARQCINEQTIGIATDHPLHLPTGTTILINTYAVHRRAEYWSRPNEFDYTRWLRDPVTGLKPKLTHPFCYLPFAAGPRNCIGQNFALLEAKVMLAMLIQRCYFELEPGQKIIPEIRLTMKPKYGLFARISKRC